MARGRPRRPVGVSVRLAQDVQGAADEIAKLLRVREIDAGVRYISGAPNDDLEEVPLYDERYQLLTTASGRFGDLTEVPWSALASQPLCLFAPSLQLRKIIDDVLRNRGVEVQPAIETDSVLALTTHVRTGRWVSVISSLVGDSLELSDTLRTIPIVNPEVVSAIGLVVSKRYPSQPAMSSLIAEVRRGFTYIPPAQPKLRIV